MISFKGAYCVAIEEMKKRKLYDDHKIIEGCDFGKEWFFAVSPKKKQKGTVWGAENVIVDKNTGDVVKDIDYNWKDKWASSESIPLPNE